jgi:hypothetical protein
MHKQTITDALDNIISGGGTFKNLVKKLNLHNEQLKSDL